MIVDALKANIGENNPTKCDRERNSTNNEIESKLCSLASTYCVSTKFDISKNIKKPRATR